MSRRILQRLRVLDSDDVPILLGFGGMCTGALTGGYHSKSMEIHVVQGSIFGGLIGGVAGLVAPVFVPIIMIGYLANRSLRSSNQSDLHPTERPGS